MRTVHEKRFQVFISSTFTDLVEERRAVQDTIISMGDFPVQMESFPATDERQMEYIAPLIEGCDYYVLIIGGRYGSIDPGTGLSFTHMEFRHAVSCGIPVIVLTHGNPADITSGKTEDKDVGKRKLREFIAEAQADRIRKQWISKGDLQLAVTLALDHAKRAKPRTGWVRGDSVASAPILEELNEVRKENEKYRDLLGSIALDIPLPSLPSALDETTLSLVPSLSFKKNGNQRRGSSARVTGAWISFFPVFYSQLDFRSHDWNGDYHIEIKHEESCVAIGSAIAGELSIFDTTGAFQLTRSSLDKLIAYYTEIGLMVPGDIGETPFTAEAQRVARRYFIAETSPKFRLTDGEISLTDVSYSSYGEHPDDIPF